MGEERKTEFAEACLKLVKEKKLKDITVSDLLHETGSSRQTFYRYFWGKEQLIQYIYTSKIAGPVKKHYLDHGGNFLSNLLYSYIDNNDFLTQAQADSPYIQQQTTMLIEWWLALHYSIIKGALNQRQYEKIHFYSLGAGSMIMEWLLSDSRSTPSELANHFKLCFPEDMQYLLRYTIIHI